MLCFRQTGQRNLIDKKFTDESGAAGANFDPKFAHVGNIAEAAQISGQRIPLARGKRDV